MSKGDLTISYQVSRCFEISLMSCTESVSVKYERDKQLFKVTIDKNFVVNVNGEIIKDPRFSPFRSKFLTVKRVSTGFVMVNGFGFQLLYGGITGKIEITLDPFYSNKVCYL